ncbi:lipid droplet-regulating VLDL assembly factor AUP1 isoform X1 [Patagioenas fasciata]|uniref:lipid droplet-regulating VLDL assembly factor AUP1 isoform X1 n=1 Tax=Patagioenas fasciata TaxID=372321 RepID=UPI003A99817F
MEPPGPGPERLFDSHRFPTDGFLLLALLLYAPVGLCLLVLRLFIGAHVFLVSCTLPDSVLRRFIVRVMCSVLGLFVRQSDPRLRDASVRVYIANHVTQFDHNVINLLTSCNTPALNAAPGFLCWSRGFLELGAGSRAELVHSLKAYSSHGANPPLLLFPEEAATNGRAGLLRFSSWPFSLADVVQPVALHVQRPLVTVSVADSSWITELLWTFFAPFTVYQVRWLPSVPRRAEEPSEDFALRVQELLAVELGVVSTRLTAADKAEHMKRLRHTSLLPFAPGSSQPLAARPRVPSGLGTAEDARIAAMAQRVKEVLPHVPLEVIRTDLARTSCVDTTIANLLEGSVPFCPESGEDSADLPAPAPSAPAAASSTQGSAAAPAKPAPKQFAKSPVERHLSLQERKRALYDYARSRFAQKLRAARGGP